MVRRELRRVFAHGIHAGLAGAVDGFDGRENVGSVSLVKWPRWGNTASGHVWCSRACGLVLSALHAQRSPLPVRNGQVGVWQLLFGSPLLRLSRAGTAVKARVKAYFFKAVFFRGVVNYAFQRPFLQINWWKYDFLKVLAQSTVHDNGSGSFMRQMLLDLFIFENAQAPFEFLYVGFRARDVFEHVLISPLVHDVILFLFDSPVPLVLLLKLFFLHLFWTVGEAFGYAVVEVGFVHHFLVEMPRNQLFLCNLLIEILQSLQFLLLFLHNVINLLLHQVHHFCLFWLKFLRFASLFVSSFLLVQI